jgi:hypothetical protein
MRIGKESNTTNSEDQQAYKMNKEEISTYLSINILNVNSFNSPIKDADWLNV